MQAIEMNVTAFADALASSAPTPGGGGASALVGAIGAALGSMVGNLTVGKRKYADVEDEIKALLARCETLRVNLLRLVERDAEVFAPLAKAYGLPGGTDAERVEKARVMEGALREACSVPLEIMERCCEVIDLMDGFAKKGSRLAVSDAGCGAVFCKAALQAASLNVLINTKAMADQAYAAEINAKARRMLDAYTTRADEIFSYVCAQF